MISFFDKERFAISSRALYIGTVVVASPSWQILFFADRDRIDDFDKLGEFLSVKEQDGNRVIQILEPLVHPSDTFGLRVFPSVYDISKEEAEALAYDWIARQELIPNEEAEIIYSTKSFLAQYPGIVSEHVWRVYFYKEGQVVPEY